MEKRTYPIYSTCGTTKHVILSENDNNNEKVGKVDKKILIISY